MGGFDPLLVDLFYRGVTEPSAFASALQSMVHSFNCKAAAMVSIDAYAPATNMALTAGVLSEYRSLYQEQFAAIDPAPVLFSRLPPGTPSTTNRMFTPDQLRREPFVQEFFRPIGLVETLGGHLFSENGHFALVGLQRGADRDDFTDDEIADLARLLPHITRVLQLRRVFGGAAMMASGLQAAVDRLHAGVMLLDSKGVALFVNAAMRGIANRGDGFMLDRAARPLPVNLGARQTLERLLANGGTGGTFVVPRTNGRTAYVGIVAPAPSTWNDEMWERRGRTEALVILHDPDQRGRDLVAVLQQGLHLTRATAKLVAALAGDDDLKRFADREGITIHTARFHLRAALARTGARNQAEIVRIAVRLLRDIAMAE